MIPLAMPPAVRGTPILLIICMTMIIIIIQAAITVPLVFVCAPQTQSLSEGASTCVDTGHTLTKPKTNSDDNRTDRSAERPHRVSGRG